MIGVLAATGAIAFSAGLAWLTYLAAEAWDRVMGAVAR